MKNKKNPKFHYTTPCPNLEPNMIMTFLPLNIVYSYDILYEICKPDFTKNKGMVAIFAIFVKIFKNFRGLFLLLFLLIQMLD